MNKLLITPISFVFVFVFNLHLLSQNKLTTIIPPPDTLFLPKITGTFFIERKNFAGNQYFLQEWVEGTILLGNNEKIEGELLKYNGVYDELIWLNQVNFGIFRIDKPGIKEFWLGEQNENNFHFKQITLKTSGSDSVQNIFAEVMYEGRLALYVHRKIEIRGTRHVTVNNIKQKYDVLVDAPVYYIKLTNGNFLKLSHPRNRNLLKLFPEKREQIKKTLNSSRLNIRDEGDFKQLIGIMDKHNLL